MADSLNLDHVFFVPPSVQAPVNLYECRESDNLLTFHCFLVYRHLKRLRIMTSGGTLSVFQSEIKVFGDPLASVWRQLTLAFNHFPVYISV